MVSGVFRLEALRLLFALAFGIQDKSRSFFFFFFCLIITPELREEEKKNIGDGNIDGITTVH